MREEDLTAIASILESSKLKVNSVLIVGNDKPELQASIVSQKFEDVICGFSNWNFEHVPWTGKKYDLLIACNVLIGIRKIDQWFKNVKPAADLLVVQGLISGKRGRETETDPENGDHTRFSFKDVPTAGYSLESNYNIIVSNTQFYDGPNCKKFVSIVSYPQKVTTKKVK